MTQIQSLDNDDFEELLPKRDKHAKDEIDELSSIFSSSRGFMEAMSRTISRLE